MSRLAALVLVASTGCAPWAKAGVSFTLHQTEGDPCAWVERHEFRTVALPGAAPESSGQVYLYYCCPTDVGQPPECMTPRWEVAHNDRRPIPSLETLEREASRR
jgi:hypothetical protein